MSGQDFMQLTLFQEDSPASRSALPGSEEARTMTVTSGRRCLEYCGMFGPVGLLVRTLLESSIWRSTRCLLTWKMRGTPARRLLFQLVPSTPPHRRDRVAIVAYSEVCGLQGLRTGGEPERGTPSEAGTAERRGDVSDTESAERNRTEQRAEPAGITGFADGSRWPAEPGVGRVVNGLPHRVDRIKCLGNAVVPQQFYPFFAAIAEIERGGGNA